MFTIFFAGEMIKKIVSKCTAALCEYTINIFAAKIFMYIYAFT